MMKTLFRLSSVVRLAACWFGAGAFLHAAAPADETFTSYAADGATVASPRTLGGFVYESDGGAKSYLTDIGTFGLTVGSGNAVVINADDSTSGTYIEIHSSNLSDNFKLVSLAVESFTSGWSDTFTITGFEGGSGTTAVASDSIDLASSDSSGSITYAKNSFAIGGVLSFDSTWQNIDTIRFTKTSGSGPKLSFDDIDISPAVVPAPIVTSATYDASTGALVVTGTGFISLSGATNDIVANKFTLTGEGGSTWTLTDTSNVEITSGTSFTLNLSATDKASISQTLNKNGTSSTGGTTYNLAAAEDWAAGADPFAVITDTFGNGITVSNVAVPAITSASYDASTGALVVTGTGFLSRSGATNDIVANKFTLTGEGGTTWTLTDTSNVEITSGTSFTLYLSATDKASVNEIINKNLTSSTGGTTYNLAAAEDWAAGADAAVSVVDATGNGINVSNVAVPAITSATYNGSTGALVVTGTNFLSLSGASNDIVANKFTLTAEGGSTYTLTDTSNVEITTGTSFTLHLSATDKASVNQIINKNGTSSTSGTTYNLAAAEDWAAGADAAVSLVDATGNGVTVSNVAVPAISHATYDANTGAVAVTGTNFLSLSGASNDVVANKFTLTGEGGSTWTLTDTSNIEITSGTSFTLNLSATDKAGVNQRLNKNGTSSSSGTTYNLAAAEDWAAGADAAVVVADLTGNGVTASNVDMVSPTVASVSVPSNATYIPGQNLDFTVNFSEAVTVNTGGGTPRIALTLDTGGTVYATYLSGTGTSALTFRYTVAAGTLDTNGVTVGALSTNDGTLKDAIGNNAILTLNSVGSTAAVLIDGVAPTVLSINRAGSSQTNASSVEYTVTFSESVTGVDTSDFSLTATGTADGTIASISGSGSTYAVTVNTITGDGTLKLTLNASGTGISDSVTNAISGGYTGGQSYTIDHSAPVVASVSVPSNGTYVAGDSLNFTVFFDSMLSVTTSGGEPRLALTVGSATRHAVRTVTGASQLVFTYVVQSGDTDADGVAVGALDLNGSTISDTAGNEATLTLNSVGSTVSVLVDGAAPTVSSSKRQAPSAASTAATSVTYRVIFGETVTGVDSADFTLTATGTAAGTIASVSSVSGTVYDITVNTLTGDGTLRLDVKSSGTGIVDNAGNALATGFTAGETYTLDNTAPAVASIARQLPATVNTLATTATWRITFNEDVTGVDGADFTVVAVSGDAQGTITAVTTVNASTYDVSVASVAGFGTLRLDLVSSGTGIADLNGSALSGGFTTGDIYLVGRTNVFDTIGLASNTALNVSGHTLDKVAQRFITSSSAPLSVANATAALGTVTGSPAPVVTIHSDDHGHPGAVVATLTNPASLVANALNTWSSSTLLSAGTAYWVMFADSSSSGVYTVNSTAATTGGAGAWLSSSAYVYVHGVEAATGPEAGALRIAIGAIGTPSIDSPLIAGATYGSPITSYTITATNVPTSFAATSLPSGLALDTSSGAITGTPTQAGVFNVTLTASNSSGASNPANLVLTVATVPLTIAANSTSRYVGMDNPPLSVAYTGFVNGDTAASLVTAPSVTASATITSPAGTYVLTPAGAASNNYTFTYVPGVLTIIAPPPPIFLGGGGGIGGGGSSVITRTPVTITFSGVETVYDGTPKTVIATTTPAGAPVMITYNGSATAPTNAGTYTVAASVNTSTQIGSATGTLTISKASQLIAFSALSDRESNAGDFSLSASASSGLPVSFAVTSGPAALSGNNVTLNGTAGTVTIAAVQAGNANYAAAPTISRSFNVTAGGPRIFIGDVISQAGTSKLGDLGVVLSPSSNYGQLVIVVPGMNIDLAFDFTLKPDGTFVKIIVMNDSATGQSIAGAPPVAAATRTLTFQGQLNGNTLTGYCEEAGIRFNINVQPRGATSNSAGFYEAPTLNNSTGSTYAVVGNNGEVVVLAATGDTVTGGRTTLDANGSFTLNVGTTRVQGTVDAATTSVMGVISESGAPAVSFSGVASTAVRTDRLINLSSRSRIGPSAERTLITGFVIGGAQSKRVLLRAVGPTLNGFGVTGSLSNPKLQVYDATGQLVLENDDWTGSDTAAAFAQTGAFNLPVGTRDAALVTTLPPGAYTVHVTSSSETGTALAEIYDASVNPTSEAQRLVNISSRGMVESGDGLLIGGFVVTGNAPKRMLIRGVGPTLASLGVAGALIDPKLTIYSAETKIAENDNWGTPVAMGASQVVASADEIVAAARSTGAFGLANGTRDAAIVVTLAPGAYTAQVSSVAGTSGIGLVEIYEIPE